MQRVVVAVVFIACTASAQVEFSFERTDFDSDHPPTDIVAEDLDGDGVADLVTSSQQDGRVSVWLGLGDGSFAPPFDVASLASPIGIAAGRLDADGVADLVALSDANDRVFLYTGLGDGTFASAGVVAIPGELHWVGLADLSADGLDDLIVSAGAPPTIHVAENTGGASFATAVAVPALGTAANVAVGDLDGDGDPDLLASTTYYGEWGSILLGGPGLSFDAPLFFPSSFGGQVYWAAVADMDGDGVLDAVVAEDDAFSRDTVVWKGLGDGTFEYVWWSLDSAHPSLQTVGDYNGDGSADIAARWLGEDVVGHVNDGMANLLAMGVTATGAGVEALVAADLDGDGADDLATANLDDSSVTVLLARPEEVSSWWNTIYLSTPGTQEHQMSFLNAEHAGQLYVVLGSASGTAPGIVHDGVPIPLNHDVYTAYTLGAPNLWITDSLGLLDEHGAGNATLEISAGELSTTLHGTILNHAFVVLDLGAGVLAHASPPLEVLLW